MPLYEYECECGKAIVSMFRMGAAAPQVKCESCGAMANRIFGNTGFVLKGPGDHWPSQQLKRKRQMTANNIAAGDRGRDEWRKRTPKLIDQR